MLKKQAMASLGASSETARTVHGFPQVVGALALHRNFWQKRSAGAAVGGQPASATACREILVAAHYLPVVQHCRTHASQRIERYCLGSESYWAVHHFRAIITPLICPPCQVINATTQFISLPSDCIYL